MEQEVNEEKDQVMVTPDRRHMSVHSNMSAAQMIESPKMVNIHQFMTNQLDENEAISITPSLDSSTKMIAAEMMQGTYDVINYKAYANFIGSKNNTQILKAFISLLKPFPKSLLLSLRSLVGKIYFIAEAQNIDRILEELSKQWVQSCDASMWKNQYKLCHIVLFALLILNSDLNNDRGARMNQTKFSCDNFVENTLFALNKEAKVHHYSLKDVESLIMEELTAYYESLRADPLHLYTRGSSRRVPKEAVRADPRASNDLQQLNKRNSRFSLRSNTITTVNSMDVTSYRSVRSETASLQHESHFTSNWKFHHNEPLPRLYYFEPEVEKLLMERHESLMYMDGTIKISSKAMSQNDYIEEEPNVTGHKGRSKMDLLRWLKRPKHKFSLRDNKSVAYMEENTKWVKARIRIFEGRIYIFKLKESSQFLECATMDDLKGQSSKYLVFNLVEALAAVVQENIVQCCTEKGTSPISKIKCEIPPGNFTLTIPTRLYNDKATLEFQTSTVGQAQRYVNCINFWAARQAPVPKTQFELVSNEEYGWSERILTSKPGSVNLTLVHLSTWKPLLSLGALYEGLYGDLSQEDHHELYSKTRELKSFTQQIQDRIDTHNQRKPLMIELWKDTTQFDLAMDNWNNKYLYLNSINERNKAYMYSLLMAAEELNWMV